MTAVGTAGAEGLGRRFHRGLVLSLLNTLLSRFGMFVLGLILARLLAPEQFGLYAIALVVHMLMVTINEVGSAAAIVRHGGDVRPLVPTAWTLSIAWSVIGFGAAQLAAPAIAAGLGSPAATGLVRFMTLNVLLDGAAAVPGAILIRNLLQSRRLVADVTGMAVNLLATGTLALAGFGAWSLAYGNVAGTATVVVLVLALSGEWPRWGFDRTAAREVLRCGIAMIGSSLVLVALQGAPQVVTGSVLGATALGFFYLANNVANWPVAIVSNVLERIALPTFSRLREHGGDLSAALTSIVGLIAGGVLTCGVGLAVLAGPLVLVLYGPAWTPAVPALVGLSIATVARAVAELVFNLLVALNLAITALVPQIIWLIGLVPVTAAAGAVWGLAGVGWAQATIALALALPVHLWCVHRAGLDLRTLASGSLFPLALASATVVTLLLLRWVSTQPLVTVVAGSVVIAAALVVGYLRLHARVRTAMSPVTSGEGRAA